jgi:hypothetical protein
MRVPFIGKHVYQMLTHSNGRSLKAIPFSIHDMVFTNDGKYEINCLTAKDQDVKTNFRRIGSYSVKENKNNHIVLECNEETGQFIGKYEMTWDMLENRIGKAHIVSLSDGSCVDGVIEIK